MTNKKRQVLSRAALLDRSDRAAREHKDVEYGDALVRIVRLSAYDRSEIGLDMVSRAKGDQDSARMSMPDMVRVFRASIVDEGLAPIFTSDAEVVAWLKASDEGDAVTALFQEINKFNAFGSDAVEAATENFTATQNGGSVTD